MKAVEIREYGKYFVVADREIPAAGEGEVVLQVKASGLCSTDIHILEGRMDLGVLPRIPGHETAGIIHETGPGVRGWKTGERVTAAVDVVCRACRHCREGQTQRCTDKVRLGFERDGGHAEYVAVPMENLVRLPDSLSFEEASILPDAVACMYHSLAGQGKVEPGDRVVVLGAGGLGLHGIQIAVSLGARVLATSRNSERLRSAEEQGAVPVNTSHADLEAEVRNFSGGEGADVVADCIGTEESIRLGLKVVRPGGKVLVIAYLADEFKVPSLDFFMREKELIGCRGSTKADLEKVVDLTARGVLKSLIGRRFELTAINEAAVELKNGRVTGRIVLTR